MAGRISPDTISEILKMYTDGMPVKDIVRELDVDKGTVYKYLKASQTIDIDPKVSAYSSSRLLEVQKLEIVRLYKQGVKVEQIMLRVGCSRPTLYDYIRKAGITRRPDEAVVEKALQMHGTEGISMQDIVRETGLSQSTISRRVKERREAVEKARLEKLAREEKIAEKKRAK